MVDGIPCGGVFIGLGVLRSCPGLSTNQMYATGICPSCEFAQAQAEREGGEAWRRDREMLARLRLTQYDVLWLRSVLQLDAPYSGLQSTMHRRNVIAAILKVEELRPESVLSGASDVRNLLRALLR